MSNDKRARQKANRASRVAAAEDAAARARMRGRLMTYGVAAAVVVLGIVGIAILSSDDSDDTTDSGDGGALLTTTAPTTSAPQPPPPGVSAPEAGVTIDGPTECPAEDGSSERATAFTAAPPMCIDETGVFTATVDTSYGAFTIELDAAKAPLTVNNFIVLSRYGFYDGAPFHRIIPGFVIQGGDAVGNPLGTGNPGYAVDDELPAAGEYEIGSVAMANSGANTNGSQFFVITGDNGAALPPQYSLFGAVTDGLDVVMAIEGTQTTVGDAPVDEIIINSVTVVQN